MEFKKNIRTIEERIGYSFKDKALLMQAFTRTSFCNEKNYGGRENFSSNEVLEFFGDSVLSTAIVTLLLRSSTKRYSHGILTDLTEGDFSNIRSKLSDKRNLSRSLFALGLQKFMLLGEGDEKLAINEEPSVMEDLFESIIGAIYIDCGMDMETVIGVVSHMLDVSEYSKAEPVIQSFKNALQEWCADKKHRLPAPVYKTISESGPDHKKVYERGVYIGERLMGVGAGKNQKLADTAAAEAALIALKKEADAEARKSASKSSDGAARALRELATAKKQPSPEYHDLGEAKESSEAQRIYVVECIFMGRCERAEGYSKQEARDGASAKMLDAVKLGEKEQTKKSIEIPEKAKATKKSTKAPEAKAKQKQALKASESAQKAKGERKPIAKAESTGVNLAADNKKSSAKSQHTSAPKRKPHHHTKRS